jgi:hypothetical protein
MNVRLKEPADVALQVCGFCSIYLLPEDVKPEEVATVEASAPAGVENSLPNAKSQPSFEHENLPR